MVLPQINRKHAVCTGASQGSSLTFSFLICRRAPLPEQSPARERWAPCLAESLPAWFVGESVCSANGPAAHTLCLEREELSLGYRRNPPGERKADLTKSCICQTESQQLKEAQLLAYHAIPEGFVRQAPGLCQLPTMATGELACEC